MREIKSRNDGELLFSSYSTFMYFIYVEIIFKFPKYSNFCKLLQFIFKRSKLVFSHIVLFVPHFLPIPLALCKLYKFILDINYLIYIKYLLCDQQKIAIFH